MTNSKAGRHHFWREILGMPSGIVDIVRKRLGAFIFSRSSSPPVPWAAAFSVIGERRPAYFSTLTKGE